jgi:hypothetical protein
MTFYGEKKLYTNHTFHVTLKICNSKSCEGNGVVYRTSFALFLFFLIHALLVRIFREFQWMFLICKLLILIGFIIGSFWIPNNFYEGYAEFARVASALYLVVQLMVLIAWAWNCSEKLLSKIEGLENQTDENNKCPIGWYKCMLIAGTLIMVSVSIVLWALMFLWFGTSGCMFNQALIALTIVAVILLNVLSLCVDHGSIFVTALVSLYCTYLCYAGLQAESSPKCNTFYGEKNTLSLWIGISIVIATLCYQGSTMSDSAFSNNESQGDANESSEVHEMKKEEKNRDGTDEIGEEERLGSTKNYGDLEEGEVNKSKDDSKDEQKMCNEDNERKKNVIFHVAMAFASIYFAMLFTNWATDTTSTNTANQRSNVSVGVNIGAEWLCFILYLWTLCAPKICTNRKFY